MAELTRTAVVYARLNSTTLKTFIEVEEKYKEILSYLVEYAVDRKIKSHIRLRLDNYEILTKKYPQLPTHYIYTACQDATDRAKSFLKRKEEGRAYTDYPEVRNVTIWLDDVLWKMKGYTRLRISTHKGRIELEIEPHKQFWKYVNGGWVLSSGSKIKIDRRNKRLLIYLTFTKEVQEYKPTTFISVDVNENNVTALIDGKAYLFQTDMGKTVQGYYYRRKSIQERYDKRFGVKSREKNKVMKKLKERKKKNDTRYKNANILVREAKKRKAGIVSEDLGENVANEMLKHIRDKELRHRIYQASFNGTQKAIEEKAKEQGVPVYRVDPRYTSKLCPIHHVEINYGKDRHGVCKVGGEIWHRDVVAVYNILSRLGDGSTAPSPGEDKLNLNVSPVPLGMKATHDPIVIEKKLWARRKSLEEMKIEKLRNNLKHHKKAKNTL